VISQGFGFFVSLNCSLKTEYRLPGRGPAWHNEPRGRGKCKCRGDSEPSVLEETVATNISPYTLLIRGYIQRKLIILKEGEKMRKKNEGVQVENGYTKIADELLEALMGVYGHELTLAELRVMLAVIRYTYGFNRKEHKLSITYLAEKTGFSKRYMKKVIGDMIDKKLLIVYSDSTKTEARTLGINKNYWEWQVPKRNTHGGELESTMGSREHQVNSEAPGELESTREGNSEAPQEGNCRAPIINNNINNIDNIETDEVKETTDNFEIKNGKDAVVYFAKKFEEKFNVKYSANWGKDAKLMKELLETYGPELLAKMINIFLSEDDNWADKAGRTVGILKVRANSLALKATQHSHPDLNLINKEHVTHVTFVANPAWDIPLRPASRR